MHAIDLDVIWTKINKVNQPVVIHTWPSGWT